MATGFCHGCNEEKELTPFLLCASCTESAKGIVSPKIEAVIEEVKEHPIGKKVVGVFEDWAAGYRARKQKGETKP